jgi:hypothetical protein
MSIMIIVACCLLVLLITVTDLVRRRRLREEFSWLWIGACVVLIAVALITPLRLQLQEWLSAVDHVDLLLVMACLFLVALCLDFSIQVSSQSNHIKNLAQEVALLRKTVDDLRAGNDRR